jgi:hypothetical protein
MCALVACVGLAADPPAADDDLFAAKRTANGPASEAMEVKVKAALARPTKMEFVETPLQDAIDFLKDYHGIEVQLDRGALEDAGITSDTPVSRNISGLTLAAGLRLLLDGLGATYVIQHDVLLITTPQAAAHKSDLRVYAIDELVGAEAKPAEVADVLREVLGADASPASHEKPTSAEPRWCPGELCVVPYRNLLVIRASLVEHDRIASLLDQLKTKLK